MKLLTKIILPILKTFFITIIQSTGLAKVLMDTRMGHVVSPVILYTVTLGKKFLYFIRSI